MQYALVNGDKVKPTPKGRGICPGCEAPVIAKCGDVNMHHWAHAAGTVCEFEREPETEWHVNWKSLFNSNQVEVIVEREDTGQTRRADVFIAPNAVEFQNSSITAAELKARSRHYADLGYIPVWIFNMRGKAHNFVNLTSSPQIFRWKHYNRAIMELKEAAVLFDLGDGNILRVFKWHEKGFKGRLEKDEWIIKEIKSGYRVCPVAEWSEIIFNNLQDREKYLFDRGSLPPLKPINLPFDLIQKANDFRFKSLHKFEGAYRGTNNVGRYIAIDIAYMDEPYYWYSMLKKEWSLGRDLYFSEYIKGRDKFYKERLDFIRNGRR